MPAIITQERPDTADAVALINELEATLAPLYPVESRHGFAVERLIAEGVPFFVLRADGIAAACGGVKLFGTEYGEVKRMYVRPQFRGMGFAKMMLKHLADYARLQGVKLLRLETGIHQREAIGLYQRMGFHQIGPFGDYKPDPLSRFFEKQLEDEARRIELELAVAEAGDKLDVMQEQGLWVNTKEWEDFIAAWLILIDYYEDKAGTLISPIALKQYHEISVLLRK